MFRIKCLKIEISFNCRNKGAEVNNSICIGANRTNYLPKQKRRQRHTTTTSQKKTRSYQTRWTKIVTARDEALQGREAPSANGCEGGSKKCGRDAVEGGAKMKFGCVLDGGAAVITRGGVGRNFKEVVATLVLTSWIQETVPNPQLFSFLF